jgi:hypothetical protein
MKAMLITANNEMQRCSIQDVEVRQRPCEGLPGVYEVDLAHISALMGQQFVDLTHWSKDLLEKYCGVVDAECPELYQLALAGPILLLGDDCFVSSSTWLALPKKAFVARPDARRTEI